MGLKDNKKGKDKVKKKKKRRDESDDDEDDSAEDSEKEKKKKKKAKRGNRKKNQEPSSSEDEVVTTPRQGRSGKSPRIPRLPKPASGGVTMRQMRMTQTSPRRPAEKFGRRGQVRSPRRKARRNAETRVTATETRTTTKMTQRIAKKGSDDERSGDGRRGRRNCARRNARKGKERKKTELSTRRRRRAKGRRRRMRKRMRIRAVKVRPCRTSPPYPILQPSRRSTSEQGDNRGNGDACVPCRRPLPLYYGVRAVCFVGPRCGSGRGLLESPSGSEASLLLAVSVGGTALPSVGAARLGRCLGLGGRGWQFRAS